MGIVRCDMGHFYDDTKSEGCPHCASPQTAPAIFNLEEPKTEYKPKNSPIKIEMGDRKDDVKTVGMFREKLGIEPVVGWLVCTRGAECGRSYNLRGGRNHIGRSVKSDIAVPDDEMITREEHCSVVFEPKKCKYYIARGLGSNVFVDGEPLVATVELRGDETIELGASAFVFIPYCKEGRVW